MRFFRPARSSNWAARLYAAEASAEVVADRTFFKAVRSSLRRVRFRAWAAFDFRMAFAADLIRGTATSGSGQIRSRPGWPARGANCRPRVTQGQAAGRFLTGGGGV